jgi:hypothetical protein
MPLHCRGAHGRHVPGASCAATWRLGPANPVFMCVYIHQNAYVQQVVRDMLASDDGAQNGRVTSLGSRTYSHAHAYA